ncbi:MAG: hypothetical protein ACRYHA_07415 [Janthinobacterium lividum]
MEPIHHTLLDEIKRRTGWPEVELAARLGVSQATVNRILHCQADCRGRTMQSIQQLHAELFPADLNRPRVGVGDRVFVATGASSQGG